MNRKLKLLNKSFARECGFDIVDTSAKTDAEARVAAKKHIAWFRRWAEDSARVMENTLDRILPEREGR